MTITKTDTVTVPEKWSTASSRYQERIGRTTVYGTRRIVQIVNRLKPFSKDSYCLDVGTGGGSMPLMIADVAAGTAVLATDISTGMLEQVDELKLSNVSTQQEDAVTLSGLQDDAFSHVFTSFAIQYTPDASAAVRQLYRVLKPGGIAGIVIWGEFAGPLELHNRACRAVKPEYVPESPNANGSWESKYEHRRQLETAGFKQVNIEVCLMPFHCSSGADFCDYWFGYNNPVPGKLLAAAERQGIEMAALRSTMTAIADEEIAQGTAVYFTAVLGWGTK